MAGNKAAFETRTVRGSFEVRDDSGVPTLDGYAATFNQWYDLGPYQEMIAPGAFARTLASGPDVRLLIDHDGQPLARTKSGTLTLSSDDTGLRVAAPLDVTDPDVQRLLPKMRRGDLDQMSFAFRIPRGGDAWDDDYSHRTLNEINLSDGDVSVVTYPANPNTSTSVRARDEREAQCVLIETIVREIRAGKTHSAATLSKLTDVLSTLTDADENMDRAAAALDDAQATLADMLDTTDPDPAPDSQTNGRNLKLAQAIATRSRLRAAALS